MKTQTFVNNTILADNPLKFMYTYNFLKENVELTNLII